MPVSGLLFSPTPAQGAICVLMCWGMRVVLSRAAVHISAPILPRQWRLK